MNGIANTTSEASERASLVSSTGSALSFQALRSANLARQKEWCRHVTPDLSFRGNELAGETGEACNVIKKLERERHGWRGSRDSLAHLAEELADVIIVADLIASEAGIDLGEAVESKFNATSEKNSISIRLQGPNGELTGDSERNVGES